MQTTSTRPRHVSRWRWLATALFVILLQAVAAVLLRAESARDASPTSSAQGSAV